MCLHIRKERSVTMIFESHAHYDDEAFDEDREQLLKSFPEKGIEYVINVGANIETSKNTIELTEKYPFIYGAIGVHPNDVEELNEEKLNWLKARSNLEKVVAIGEIGLDYYYKEPEKEIQKKWFERQVELAREVKLPVIIHSRDAAKDTADMLKALKAREIGGVIHCYSYTKEMVKEFLNMGFYIGIGGVVTFNNGRKLKEAVEYIPLDNLLLETDSPYLAPVPNRGKRNSSLLIPYIAREIAAIKGISYEEVVEITNKNGRKLFFKEG